ncbi:MAG: uracil-DNA glycosylase family protein [Planctomycetota bacterium]
MMLPQLLVQARACRICEPELPRGCRPLIQGSAQSRIVVIGQAPGAAAHESGVPWDDRSGARLRAWLDVSDDEFYDPDLFALMPMGFCYPGTGKRGDLPPRPECAPEWHDRLLEGFRSVSLIVIIGKHAFERYLVDQHDTLTAGVRAFGDLLPDRVALPHPSPRNNIWLKRNPWFESEVLIALRARVRGLLDATRNRRQRYTQQDI